MNDSVIGLYIAKNVFHVCTIQTKGGRAMCKNKVQFQTDYSLIELFHQYGTKNLGESLFLRKLVLGIPAQASGKNLTRPLMPSAPRTSCVRAASPHHRKLGAGYATLPQMMIWTPLSPTVS